MRKCPPGSISEPIPSSTTKVWSERQTLVVIARVALSRLGGCFKALVRCATRFPFWPFRAWSELRLVKVGIARGALSQRGGFNTLVRCASQFLFSRTRFGASSDRISARDCARRAIPKGVASTPWVAARTGSFLAVQGSERAPPCTAKKERRFAAALAEREGFEPPVPLRVHLFSRQTHSTTLAPLRKGRQR